MAAPPSAAGTSIVDDKSPHCIPFILSRLAAYQSTTDHDPSRPFFIGLNGVQGAGKTTLVSALARELQHGQGLETLVCSIDDLYLRRTDQIEFASSHPSNALVQHRGEPGTHDMRLARELFSALERGTVVQIPKYDKAEHNGQGDRVPSSQWETRNAPGQPPIRVVIFEGWCVGFRTLTQESLAARREAPSTTLRKHSLEDLAFVNEQLRGYDVMTNAFDAFIHIDAEDPGFVYAWRLEQEAALRMERGSGMTDEKVRAFVDGYYPAYELYTEGVRGGVLKEKGPGRQLRLVVGRDRRVKEVINT